MDVVRRLKLLLGWVAWRQTILNTYEETDWVIAARFPQKYKEERLWRDGVCFLDLLFVVHNVEYVQLLKWTFAEASN